MSRKKFKILYPKDHELAGKEFKPGPKKMIVMNSNGIFFIYSGETYYPGITKLSNILPKYDVYWTVP
jgi:hypothetical protein